MTTVISFRPRLVIRCATAAFVSVLALSGCASDSPPLATLDRFYDQQLDFGSCEGRAPAGVAEDSFVDPFECASLEVPLDYDDPDGTTAHLGVMRLPATGADRIGSLVLNPGGPGGSGMVQVATAAASWQSTVIPQRFDIVGFDPRGVGASDPAISCFTDEQQDAGDNQTTLLGTSGEWTEDDTRELTRRCSEGSGGDEVLAAVGTRDSARDLDVLRAALGDDQLTFAGQSYGTRLGAVYAEMFPGNVRAMVLDGALDPRLGTAERRLQLQASFQRSFDLMAAACAQQPDCPLGVDPEKATENFQKLVRPLLSQPVPAGESRELDFARATGGVISGLYYADIWPVVIDGIAELKDLGRGDKLLEINDLFGGRAANGEWSNQTEANLAINCMDEDRRTPEQEAQLRTDIDRVSPFTATGTDHNGVSRDACESWPAEPNLGFPYAQDVTGLPDILVISTTGDPVTPYAAGQSLADSIGGTVLTVEGERHTVAQDGVSPCVNDAVAAYLTEVSAPAGDPTCRL